MNIIMRVVLCFLSVVSFGRLAQAESWDEMVSAYGYRTWWYTVINGGASLGDIEFLQYGRVIGQAVSANIRGDLVVPSRIAGLAVTRVGDYAFYGRVGLTSVRLPDGVTTIGKNAFAGCSELTSVRIPEGVTSIGDSAFEGCTKLESVIIPSSVRSIGDYAFSGCTGLKSVTIVGDEVTIGRWAFGGCSSLADANGFIIVNGILFDYQGVDSEITIPATVTSIGWYAFESQVNLVSVEIPLSVTNIDDCAFCECGGLESVVVPNSVVRIGRAAFQGCCRLTSMILPFIGACRGNSGSEEALFGHVFGWYYSTVGFIYAKQYYDQSQYHFLECHIPSSLKSVVITDESKIGYGAFYGCSGLASVMISSSVTCIEENAFCNCSGLTSITIPESVTSIGRNAFSGCSGFGDGVFATDGWALCVNGNHSSVEIPMGVKRVIPGAFAGHAELMSVTVPPSVVQIGSGCFAGCSGLNGVRISDVAAWCGIDFESTDANPLYYAKKLYLNGKEVIYLDVPRGIEKIGRYAFYNANRFLSVTIPPSVKSVGAGAFAGCGGLSAVNVGDLSAWCGIDFATAEANPLYWAKKLYLNGTEIVDLAVPSGTESIERYAFYNGVDVASVMIPDTVKSIGTDAFKGCTGIKSATVPERFSISDVFPDSRASITTVTIPADATSIADGAFSGCSKITSIAIPSTVTSIGANAFSGCIGLTEIAIPASVTGIGASAFRGCTQITEIKIPEGVGELPDSLCEDCSGLTTVVIPNSVSNISSTAFKDCGNVISVTMPGRFAMKDIFPSSYDKIQDVTILDGEKDLSNAVFAGCSALTTVVISEGVATLGEDLLYGFTNLRELTIPSTVTSIGGYALNGCSVLKTIHVSGNGDVDMLKQMLYESGFDTTGVTFDRIVYCKVKFDPQGGVAEWTEAEVREGMAVGGLPAVTCDGYEFLGWFTAASGGTKVTAATVVSAAVTYYAHWTPENYEIVYKLNGGVNATRNPATYTIEDAITLAVPTRSGYAFQGWTPNGGVIAKGSTGNRVFTAQWEKVAVPDPPSTDPAIVCNIKAEYRTKADVGVIPVEVVNVGEAVKIAVKGLPSGVKFTAKDMKATAKSAAVPANSIYGTPTKSGVYAATVTVTPTNRKSKMSPIVKTLTFVVRNAGEHIVRADCDAAQGSVKGMGVYAKGKKATLKATAAKGWVFAGWYDGNALVSPLASYALTMPEKDVNLTARFISVSEDKAAIRLAVDGTALSGGSGQETASPLSVEVRVGMYVEWPVAASALSATTVKVSGLPSGLKFTAKDVKATKTSAAVPANTIYGIPKTTSKVDKKGNVTPSKVKITVTTAGKSKQEYVLNVTVRGIPAEGTFNGGSANGLVTLTVAKTGKVSGKYLADGKTWTLSAAGFDSWDDNDRMTATLTVKSGKEVKTVALAYENGHVCASLTSGQETASPLFEAWKNEWNAEPLKTLAKKLKGQKVQVGEVRLSVGANGAVTAKGTFGGYSASCSTVLIPTDAEGVYVVYLYFPPKAGKFDGFAGVVEIALGDSQ